MKTTIDAAGRVVIPKAIREKAGITARTPLEVHYRDGRVEIEIPASDVKLVMVNGLPVLKGPPGGGQITAEQVEEIRQAIRDERERRILGLDED